MHILIISHYQDDGSISASFVEDQAMAYLDLGHDVTMISPVVIGKHYRNKPPQKKIYKGLTVYYPRYFSASKYGEYNINVFFGYSSVGRLFRKLAREKYFDIIHAHTIGFDGAVAVKLKKKYGIPAIITTHGTDTIGEIKKGNGEKLIPICNEADAVIAVSTKLKRLLLALEPSLNVSVIPNGYLAIDTEDKKINKKPYTLLQVSGLIPQKNVDITIKAFSNIIKKIPNAELVIIGSGPLRDELESLCAKLDVDSHVTFMGQVSNEEVLHVMAKSQIFIMPSVDEGLGIVYLEAMSQRCVTIGSKGEGIEDIIENGKTGFLINPYNLSEIEDCIYQCMCSYKLCNEISLKGFQTVQDLTWERNAQNYIRIMDKLI